MGSPLAFLFQMLTFATMEMLVLIPKHKKSIVVCKRQTYVTLVIWRKYGAYDNELE